MLCLAIWRVVFGGEILVSQIYSQSKIDSVLNKIQQDPLSYRKWDTPAGPSQSRPKPSVCFQHPLTGSLPLTVLGLWQSRRTTKGQQPDLFCSTCVPCLRGMIAFQNHSETQASTEQAPSSQKRCREGPSSPGNFCGFPGTSRMFLSQKQKSELRRLDL